MMKILFIFLVLLTSTPLFSASSGGRTKINSTSWSLLYGYSQNVNEQGYKPKGFSYKFQLGNRWENNFEMNFFLRYASQKSNLTFSSIDGNIGRTDLTAGFIMGYWLFSALNLHTGYAFHNNTIKVTGAYSATQISTIKTDHQLNDEASKGLMAGIDLVLLQSSSFQLFTNYDYYHLNHLKAHDWEAMVGLRFYPGSSKGGGSGGSGSYFNKIFSWVFEKKP